MGTVIEEWDRTHPRWGELVQCIHDESDEANPQEVWAFQVHPLGWPGMHFLAALNDGKVVGFLKFMEQVIGPPDDRAPIMIDDVALTEAKVTAFGVRKEWRGRGIGTALQEAALRRAAELGCYQVRSHSDFTNHANYAVKMKLGFAAVPDFRRDDPSGVFWVKSTQGYARQP